jgi:hypothetical protein
LENVASRKYVVLENLAKEKFASLEFLTRRIEKLLISNKLNSSISVLGCEFHPSKTIFQDTNSDEIIEAWEFTTRKISLKDFLRETKIMLKSMEI